MKSSSDINSQFNSDGSQKERIDIFDGPKIEGMKEKKRQEQHAYMDYIGVTGRVVELMTMETDEDMLKLKNNFRLNFPVLMSTIL